MIAERTPSHELHDPLYPISHAAHYLGINPQTLRTWVLGRDYTADAQRRFWEPLIPLETHANEQLSFTNLIEAHVLSSMRKKHKLKMPIIRKGIDYVSDKIGKPHPLATQDFAAIQGHRLFTKHLGELIDLSATEQRQLTTVLEAHLDRIERDVDGIAQKLYPITRLAVLSQKMIVINPRVSYGRPIIEDVGVSTDIIANRWLAGDPFGVLREDYRLTNEQIEEAIWYEKHRAA